jgi:hypothetical protein
VGRGIEAVKRLSPTFPVNLQLNRGDHAMARSSKSGSAETHKTGTPVKASEVPWGGYVDLRLDEDDKSQFVVWSNAERQSYWLDFVELLGKGFKFGLSYVVEDDCYIASFTAYGERLIGLNDRYCLTARSPEWEEAVMLLIFKHLVMARGNWGNFKPKSRKMERFG